MKYDHIVKVNGRYYSSGTDVPKINNNQSVDTENISINSGVESESVVNKRGRPKRK